MPLTISCTAIASIKNPIIFFNISMPALPKTLSIGIDNINAIYTVTDARKIQALIPKVYII